MKKVVAIAAVAVLVATLCGCGSSASSSSSSSASSAATSSSSSASHLSDAEYQALNSSIANIIADEWDGYDYLIDLNETQGVVHVYVGATVGTKDNLTADNETAMSAWSSMKDGIIEQNKAIKSAAASAMPNLQVEFYLVEGLDTDAVSAAINKGSYTPTDYDLYVKDSTIVYDVASA